MKLRTRFIAATGALSLGLITALAQAPIANAADYDDQENVSFTATNGMTSEYHVYASGVPAPSGLLIWTHGDGAYEFINPDSDYVMGGPLGVRALAKTEGYIVVSALAPDTDGTPTWWEAGADNADYMADLIEHLQAEYDIDSQNIVLAGFSGGAQFTTQYFLPEYSATLEGGGSIVFGGGGPPDTLDEQPWNSDLFTSFSMHWATGALDDLDHSDEGYDALCYAQEGYDFYTDLGFENTSYNWIPGYDHVIDGLFGEIVAEQLRAHKARLAPASIAPASVGAFQLMSTSSLDDDWGYEVEFVDHIPQLSVKVPADYEDEFENSIAVRHVSTTTGVTSSWIEGTDAPAGVETFSMGSTGYETYPNTTYSFTVSPGVWDDDDEDWLQVGTAYVTGAYSTGAWPVDVLTEANRAHLTVDAPARFDGWRLTVDVTDGEKTWTASSTGTGREFTIGSDTEPLAPDTDYTYTVKYGVSAPREGASGSFTTASVPTGDTWPYTIETHDDRAYITVDIPTDATGTTTVWADGPGGSYWYDETDLTGTQTFRIGDPGDPYYDPLSPDTTYTFTITNGDDDEVGSGSFTTESEIVSVEQWPATVTFGDEGFVYITVDIPEETPGNTMVRIDGTDGSYWYQSKPLSESNVFRMGDPCDYVTPSTTYTYRITNGSQLHGTGTFTTPARGTTTPPVDPTPVDEDELTDPQRGDVTAPDEAKPGDTITVFVGTGLQGQEVDVWMHSTPVYLGRHIVSVAGTVQVILPAGVTAGDHRIVVLAADGTLIGWDGIRIAASTGSLQATGLETTVPVIGGMLLLLLGAGAVVFTRLRSRVTAGSVTRH